MPFVQFLIHSKKLLMFIKTIIFFIFNVSLFSIFLVGSILKSNGCTEVPDQQPCVSLLNTLIKDPQQRRYIVTALFKIKRKVEKYCSVRDTKIPSIFQLQVQIQVEHQQLSFYSFIQGIFKRIFFGPSLLLSEKR